MDNEDMREIAIQVWAPLRGSTLQDAMAILGHVVENLIRSSVPTAEERKTLVVEWVQFLLDQFETRQ